MHWSTFKFFFAIVLMDRVKEWRLKGKKMGMGGGARWVVKRSKRARVTTIRF